MSELETKDFIFEVKTNKDDGEFYTFSGYASTFGNVDQVGDIIEKNAFSNLKRNPKLLYQHDPQQPIGVITSIKNDANGLFIEAKLPKGHSLANDVGILLKCGALDSMSVGFVIKDHENNGNNRIIKKVDLHEVSIITFPANLKAVIGQVKSLEDSTTYDKLKSAESKKEFEKILRDSGFSKKAATFVASEHKPLVIQSDSVITELKTIINNLREQNNA